MQILKENMVCVGMETEHKEDLLLQVSKKFAGLYKKVGEQEILKALLEREELGSTGFGNRIALPHAKIEGLDFFSIYVGTLKHGVDFNSRDKKKVKLVLGILGPAGRDREYLKLLAQVSKMIREESIILELLSAKSDYDLFRNFVRNFVSLTVEAKPEKKGESKKLLIFHLREEKFLYEIINLLVENKLYNTVISESTTFEGYVSKSPLFGGFLDFLSECSGVCKTITSPVPERMIPRLMEEVEKIMGDLNTHTGISITALDISYQKGSLT
jgi:mannitol/fructose-specific phosphotransferase system IIA component (Ntr-type)